MTKNKLSRLEQFLNEHPDLRIGADVIVLPPSAAEILKEFPDADSEVLSRCDEPHSIGGGAVTRGAMYVICRRDKNEFSAMVALQRGPALKTDVAYYAGRKRPGDEMSDAQLKAYLHLTKRHGFTPGPSDIYNPMIARMPGDPEAWIPSSGGRDYVKKLAQKRGVALHGSDGSEIVQAREPEHEPFANAPKLAPDLIRANARRMIRKDPALRTKKPQELREMVLAKHGPK